jgi:hypothetical protein
MGIGDSNDDTKVGGEQWKLEDEAQVLRELNCGAEAITCHLMRVKFLTHGPASLLIIIITSSTTMRTRLFFS